MPSIFLGVIPYLIFLHMVLTRCTIFKNSDLIKMLYIECGILDRIFFMFVMSNLYFMIAANVTIYLKIFLWIIDCKICMMKKMIKSIIHWIFDAILDMKILFKIYQLNAMHTSISGILSMVLVESMEIFWVKISTVSIIPARNNIKWF